jgi:hypothetical protein
MVVKTLVILYLVTKDVKRKIQFPYRSHLGVGRRGVSESTRTSREVKCLFCGKCLGGRIGGRIGSNE